VTEAPNRTDAPTALVIDDDEAVLEAIAQLMASLGFRVVKAGDGLEGVEAFRQETPAVVLTDIVMPNQDGIGAILQMRRIRPDVKIVAMSGLFDPRHGSYLNMARELGADAILVKPFRYEELMEVLCGILRDENTKLGDLTCRTEALNRMLGDMERQLEMLEQAARRAAARRPRSSRLRFCDQ
jgi:DNA-binding response OmpR family regulator